MPQDKKFIITKDKSVGDALIAHGFYLLSNISGTYTFVNQVPEKFSFDALDTNKVHFTNQLCL